MASRAVGFKGEIWSDRVSIAETSGTGPFPSPPAPPRKTAQWARCWDVVVSHRPPGGTTQSGSGLRREDPSGVISRWVTTAAEEESTAQIQDSTHAPMPRTSTETATGGQASQTGSIH